MIFGGQEQDIEQRRTTLGLAFLVLGLLLLMWAWGSWMYRASTSASTSTKTIAADRDGEPDEKTEKAIRIATPMMLGGVILVIVFLAASFVLVRASRRYRDSLRRTGPKPSDSSDVWAMHKLREFPDDES